jgi:hypothetical protein
VKEKYNDANIGTIPRTIAPISHGPKNIIAILFLLHVVSLTIKSPPLLSTSEGSRDESVVSSLSRF